MGWFGFGSNDGNGSSGWDNITKNLSNSWNNVSNKFSNIGNNIFGSKSFDNDGNIVSNAPANWQEGVGNFASKLAGFGQTKNLRDQLNQWKLGQDQSNPDSWKAEYETRQNNLGKFEDEEKKRRQNMVDSLSQLSSAFDGQGNNQEAIRQIINFYNRRNGLNYPWEEK